MPEDFIFFELGSDSVSLETCRSAILNPVCLTFGSGRRNPGYQAGNRLKERLQFGMFLGKVPGNEIGGLEPSKFEGNGHLVDQNRHKDLATQTFGGLGLHPV